MRFTTQLDHVHRLETFDGTSSVEFVRVDGREAFYYWVVFSTVIRGREGRRLEGDEIRGGDCVANEFSICRTD